MFFSITSSLSSQIKDAADGRVKGKFYQSGQRGAIAENFHYFHLAPRDNYTGSPGEGGVAPIVRQRYRPVHQPSHKLAAGVAGKKRWSYRGGAAVRWSRTVPGLRSRPGHKGGLNEAAAEAIPRDSFLHRRPNKSTS